MRCSAHFQPLSKPLSKRKLICNWARKQSMGMPSGHKLLRCERRRDHVTKRIRKRLTEVRHSARNKRIAAQDSKWNPISSTTCTNPTEQKDRIATLNHHNQCHSLETQHEQKPLNRSKLCHVWKTTKIEHAIALSHAQRKHNVMQTK